MTAEAIQPDAKDTPSEFDPSRVVAPLESDSKRGTAVSAETSESGAQNADAAAETESDPQTDALPGVPLIPEHREYLIAQGISEAWLDGGGARLLRSATEPEHLPESMREWVEPCGILFLWKRLDGHCAVQFRPDNPPLDTSSVPPRPRKYLFEKGVRIPYGVIRQPVGAIGRVVIQEGSKQGHALAAYASEPGDLIVAIPGCQNWRDANGGVAPELLAAVVGKPVILTPDADAASNDMVYDSFLAFAQALEGAAESVEFGKVPGGGKRGIDDYLASLPGETRADAVTRLLASTSKKPAPKRPKNGSWKKGRPLVTDNVRGPDTTGGSGGEGNAIFPVISRGEIEAAARIPVDQIARAVARRYPMAIGLNKQLWVYQSGKYVYDPEFVNAVVGETLGDRFTTGAVANVEARLRGIARKQGRFIPEMVDQPWVCFTNGLLDLDTGRLMPHSPDFMVTWQIPFGWDPDAVCPTYDEWGAEYVGAEQLAVLEEAAAQALDPSSVSTKALMLYGLSRSGKGTFLSLMRALVGVDQTSEVTLKDLAEDKHMGAHLLGKALNIDGDMASGHLPDISLFKKATGEDRIMGNEKYGKTFSFLCTALFMMGANEPPTVGETSRAYLNRMVPIWFTSTFEHKVDPEVKKRMMAELPGIVVRLVKAHQARKARGKWLPIPEATMSDFAAKSDRVVRFLSQACNVGVTGGYTKGLVLAGEYHRGPATDRTLHQAFCDWASEGGGHTMTLQNFVARLDQIPGVDKQSKIRRSDGTRVRPVEVRLKDDWFADLWDDSDLDEDPSGNTVTEDAEAATVSGTAPNSEERTTAHPVVATAPNCALADLASVPAMSRVTPQFLDLVRRRAITVDGGDPGAESTIYSAAPAVLLTEVAASLALPPEVARQYLRATANLLFEHGVVLRERRLACDGDLSSGCVPLSGTFVHKDDKAAASAAVGRLRRRRSAAKKRGDTVEFSAIQAELDQALAYTAEVSATAEHLPVTRTAYVIAVDAARVGMPRPETEGVA